MASPEYYGKNKISLARKKIKKLPNSVNKQVLLEWVNAMERSDKYLFQARSLGERALKSKEGPQRTRYEKACIKAVEDYKKEHALVDSYYKIIRRDIDLTGLF